MYNFNGCLFASDSLQNYFSQFGEVSDCIVMKNPQTGKSRGFGFVSYKDPASVDVVLSTSSHSIDGRKVLCVQYYFTLINIFLT